MSCSDLRVDINVTDTLNKNYWPAELIQDNVRGSSRQAENVVCQPYVTGYMYLRLCANVGAAAGLHTPGNGQEKSHELPMSEYQRLAMSLVGKIQPLIISEDNNCGLSGISPNLDSPRDLKSFLILDVGDVCSVQGRFLQCLGEK